MIAVFKKELWAYFGNWSAWVIIASFSLLGSLFLFFFENNFNFFDIGAGHHTVQFGCIAAAGTVNQRIHQLRHPFLFARRAEVQKIFARLQGFMRAFVFDTEITPDGFITFRRPVAATEAQRRLTGQFGIAGEYIISVGGGH